MSCAYETETEIGESYTGSIPIVFGFLKSSTRPPGKRLWKLSIPAGSGSGSTMKQEEQPMKKQKTVEELGWRDGSVSEFLGLTPEEERLIEIRLRLSDLLRKKRRSSGLTQVALANSIKTSQSRLAKAEAGSANVSLDLIVRATLAAGATTADIGKELAKESRSRKPALRKPAPKKQTVS